MLDFIPLPRILPGLLARGDSWYTSAKARDRYPFLFLILDFWEASPSAWHIPPRARSFRSLFFSFQQPEVTVNPIDDAFLVMRVLRTSVHSLVCSFSLLFHSLFSFLSLSSIVGRSRL